MVNSDVRAGDFVYDVALSFAGEQRTYVQKVAAALRRRGIRPFYDDYEKATLWGKDLYEHLDWIYQKAARYRVLFASKDYAEKVWTTHERRSAQARALQSNQEYVLPVRFDDTEIPGLRPTIVYVDARSLPSGKLAELISKKLDPRIRKRIAVSFMQTLMRMTVDDRRLVVHIFAEGCRTQLPDNIHISLDIMRRDLGIVPTALVERMRAMAPIGFEEEIRSDEEHGDDVLVVRWGSVTRVVGSALSSASTVWTSHCWHRPLQARAAVRRGDYLC